MPIATVLTLVDGGSGSEAALKTGLAVGRSHEAYVEAVHFRPGPQQLVPIVADGLSGAAMEQIIRNAEAATEERADKAKALFQSTATELSLHVIEPDNVNGGGFAVAWQEMTGDRQTQSASRARLFDLVVVARPTAEEAGGWAEVETMLIDSGRPVLVAPPVLTENEDLRRPCRHVVVAWNNTRESARGAWAAQPFLKAAERVSVITISDRAEDADRAGANPADLAKALRHRKIEAQVVTLSARNREVGDLLLDQAGDLGADLLVMGAYGHSRLREFVFGGATLSVLNRAEIPVLMAH